MRQHFCPSHLTLPGASHPNPLDSADLSNLVGTCGLIMEQKCPVKGHLRMGVDRIEESITLDRLKLDI